MASCHFSSVQHHGHFVPFFYIGSSGDDLDGLRPDVHLADDQFIRIRVALDLLDLSCYDLFQIFIKTLIAFYLGPG